MPFQEHQKQGKHFWIKIQPYKEAWHKTVVRTLYIRHVITPVKDSVFKALRNSRSEKKLATVQELVYDLTNGNTNDLTYRRSSETFSKKRLTALWHGLYWFFPSVGGRLINKMWWLLVNKVMENWQSTSILATYYSAFLYYTGWKAKNHLKDPLTVWIWFGLASLQTAQGLERWK